MYDELIKRLIETSIDFGESDHISVMMIEAADAIEELQQVTTHYEEESKGWWLAACDAKEERERLKDQIPKWIPVTERLPEKYDRVLVYSKATRMGRGIDFINADGNWYSTQKVSHWMPLPQPPKDGES